MSQWQIHRLADLSFSWLALVLRAHAIFRCDLQALPPKVRSLGFHGPCDHTYLGASGGIQAFSTLQPNPRSLVFEVGSLLSDDLIEVLDLDCHAHAKSESFTELRS